MTEIDPESIIFGKEEKTERKKNRKIRRIIRNFIDTGMSPKDNWYMTLGDYKTFEEFQKSVEYRDNELIVIERRRRKERKRKKEIPIDVCRASLEWIANYGDCQFLIFKDSWFICRHHGLGTLPGCPEFVDENMYG